jgi:hypothetical protein
MFSIPGNNGVYQIVSSYFELVLQTNTQMIYPGSGPSHDIKVRRPVHVIDALDVTRGGAMRSYNSRLKGV